MDKHQEYLIKKAEALGWTVRIDGNEWDFSQYSPAGEDFSFCVEANVDSVAAAVAAFSVEFDVNDHVMLWIDSMGKNGVPGSVRTLLEDAESIGLMLHVLGNYLMEAEIEWDKLMEMEVQNGFCREDLS